LRRKPRVNCITNLHFQQFFCHANNSISTHNSMCHVFVAGAGGGSKDGHITTEQMESLSNFRSLANVLNRIGVLLWGGKGCRRERVAEEPDLCVSLLHRSAVAFQSSHPGSRLCMDHPSNAHK
jgi:hypothetical protein